MKQEKERYKKETERFEKIISSIDLQELKGVPVFGEEKWSAAEEIVLLTSMQNHNYGNWNLLAEILTATCQKKFTSEEVEEHYIKTYLEGDIAEALNSAQPTTSKCSLIEDHTTEKDDECLKSADLNAFENVPPKFLQDIGYMPLREDFEREYDSAAEDLLTNLDFIDVTDIYDRSMYMILLDTYRSRLMERIERKKVVKKYRIVEQFYAQTDLNYDKKFLDDKSLYSTPLTGLPSPEHFNNHKMPDVSDMSLPSKKSRYARLKHLSVRKNLEKKFTLLTDCEDDETGLKRKSKTNHRRSLRSSKSTKFLPVQSDDSSENEIEPVRKANLGIDEFPCSEHLSEAEKKLCSDLGLMPVYYLYYRCFLTWIDLERTEGRFSNANMIPAHMTVAQCSRIVNFMEKSGLIRNQNLLNIADAEE